MARINNSRKALFQTPGSSMANSSIAEEHSIVIGSSSMTKSDIAEKALAGIHAENEFTQGQKDLHRERMANLKLLLNKIDEDNWKYDNVSKLIGI